MGMFDSINAKLECPDTKKSEEQEIQIKWREFRLLDHFKIGDTIKDLLPNCDNQWIRADYICQSCSKKTDGQFGEYIKSEDQKWHYCFVKIENKTIKEILPEEKFYNLGIEDYLVYD